MKGKFTYTTVIILFVVAVLFIFFKFKQDDKPKAAIEYKLLSRPGSSALTAEWAKTEKNASDLRTMLDKDPNDKKSKLAMAALFIQEARVTGNHAYYDMAAMKYVDEVLAQEPANFLGLIFKAIISLSQHHFAEGLTYAGQAQKVNPNNAYVYGLLVDGNVEMGNYAAAVENSDKMISIRPDTKSYSRISYLREIHGDYPGAIEAMKMAIDAGPPGDESAARVT
jgi:tetratricopeptide (TPR) repeat protein